MKQPGLVTWLPSHRRGFTCWQLPLFSLQVADAAAAAVAASPLLTLIIIKKADGCRVLPSLCRAHRTSGHAGPNASLSDPISRTPLGFMCSPIIQCKPDMRALVSMPGF